MLYHMNINQLIESQLCPGCKRLTRKTTGSGDAYVFDCASKTSSTENSTHWKCESKVCGTNGFTTVDMAGKVSDYYFLRALTGDEITLNTQKSKHASLWKDYDLYDSMRWDKYFAQNMSRIAESALIRLDAAEEEIEKLKKSQQEQPGVMKATITNEKTGDKKVYELRDHPEVFDDSIYLPLKDGSNVTLPGCFYPTNISFGSLEQDGNGDVGNFCTR